MSHSNKDIDDRSEFDDFFADDSVVKMPEVMIDIETMGTRPNAPMVAIGAVAFNLHSMTMGERYYANIDLNSSVEGGAVLDPDTVMWWLSQSDEARAKLTSGTRVHVLDFLKGFSTWLDDSCVSQRDRKVWACGTDFDNTILAEHYRRASLPVPWRYYNSRDQRTVRDLWPAIKETVRRKGTHHNALDDAIFQVEVLFTIRKTLRGQQ